MTATGVLVALAAASCYEIAYVLQALAARREGGGERLRVTLLARLARHPLWVGGTALSAGGSALQVLALTLAPLTLVQPALSLGLVLLLVLARAVLGETLGRRDLYGIAGIVVGVAIVVAAAPPGQVSTVDAGRTAVLLGSLAAVTLAPFALRWRVADARARVVAAAAGDAGAAIAMKLVATATERGAWPVAAGWAAAALALGLLALTAEMSALGAIPATRIAPVVLAVQVLVPVLAAPLAFHESWHATPLGGVVLGVAALVVAGAAALIGSSGAVAGVLAGGHAPIAATADDHVGG